MSSFPSTFFLHSVIFFFLVYLCSSLSSSFSTFFPFLYTHFFPFSFLLYLFHFSSFLFIDFSLPLYFLTFVNSFPSLLCQYLHHHPLLFPLPSHLLFFPSFLLSSYLLFIISDFSLPLFFLSFINSFPSLLFQYLRHHLPFPPSSLSFSLLPLFPHLFSLSPVCYHCQQDAR